MSKADEPAFPIMGTYTNDGVGVAEPAYGLTKREYFAGLAMQGLVSRIGGYDPNLAAEVAVTSADALLLALERKPE